MVAAGGILFGIAFWSIARNISSNVVKQYMIISAYGMMILFSSKQASALVRFFYPPFGLVTLLFFGLASYLIFIGIYSSAISVAEDSELRQSNSRSCSIWITTAILMNNYREKLANSIIYWIILSIPLVYFLITYFYQYILSNLLISYLEIDPITFSILIGAFLSLSKPIGGLVFGVAFWKISKTISYEKNIKSYMFISGWGIFLIFSANQAQAQIVSPYPAFGLATITVLNIAAFLMLLGIYNSAVLVSANNNYDLSNIQFIVTLLSPTKMSTTDIIIEKLYEHWLMKTARPIFKNKIDTYSEKLDIINKPEKILIKKLKNRWGSIGKKGDTINLNINLIKCPQDVIDYMILHELCHLKIKEHSHEFWNLLHKYMPNYQTKIDWLKVNGINLI